MIDLNLPSPISEIYFEGIDISIKRDDLIHSIISGNKWRKLNYSLLKAKEEGFSTLISFGGAFSNHLHALSFAAKEIGFKSIGIIRGEYADEANPTLRDCKKFGMKIIPVPKSEYNERNNYHYHDQLRLEYPDAFIIPEGGANVHGIYGCYAICKELKTQYSIIACAVGTGTTAAGIILSKPKNTKIACFGVFKNNSEIRSIINTQLNLVLNDKNACLEYQDDFFVIDGYSFGGFAKANHDLLTFKASFEKEYNIELDTVYTSKMFYGISHLIRTSDEWKNKKILVYHSGGLQGNRRLFV